MAMSIKAQIKLVYEDASSRTYTFNGIDPNSAPDIKRHIININDSLSAGTANNFANTFVSENGQSCKMISEAKIITTEQEVIYSAN